MDTSVRIRNALLTALGILGAVVLVKGKAEALPWGSGIWVESAPAVVKALE